MAIRQDPENRETLALHTFAGSFAGKQVLEVGCGDGRLTWQYADEAALVHGIDPSQKKIDKAQATLSAALADRVSFWQVGIEHFHTTQKYDIALLSWSL